MARVPVSPAYRSRINAAPCAVVRRRRNTRHCPACVTVNVCGPILNIPVRELALEFAATESFTVPLPDPLPPEVMVSQSAWLLAVQVQPSSAVTLTLPLPPLAVND
jgi:hypothetical protein